MVKRVNKKVGVDSKHVFFLDSLETTNQVKISCSSNQSVQPLQLHYVTGDSMVSSYFNCYAKGNLSSLNWSFEDFDHKLGNGDCVFSNNEVNKQLRDLVNIKSGDFLVVVFSSMFKKQSEQLVKIAAKRSTGLTLYLVNIDAYYAGVLNE